MAEGTQIHALKAIVTSQVSDLVKGLKEMAKGTRDMRKAWVDAGKGVTNAAIDIEKATTKLSKALDERGLKSLQQFSEGLYRVRRAARDTAIGLQEAEASVHRIGASMAAAAAATAANAGALRALTLAHALIGNVGTSQAFPKMASTAAGDLRKSWVDAGKGITKATAGIEKAITGVIRVIDTKAIKSIDAFTQRVNALRKASRDLAAELRGLEGALIRVDAAMATATAAATANARAVKALGHSQMALARTGTAQMLPAIMSTGIALQRMGQIAVQQVRPALRIVSDEMEIIDVEFTKRTIPLLTHVTNTKRSLADMIRGRLVPALTTFGGVLRSSVAGGLSLAGRGVTGLLSLAPSLGTAFRRAGSDMVSAMDRTGLAVGVLTALVGGAAIRSFVGFEETMTRVGAVTRTIGTRDFAALEKEAKRLGATTRFTAQEAAEAMEAMGLAGFKVNEIIGAMPSALQLASAAQIDVGKAAEITAKTMRAYGMTAQETTRINDVLVSTFTRANTDILQLAEALRPVAPVAKSVGVSLEDTAAILAKMADAGFQGETGGTALRNALIRLAAPSKQAAEYLKDFGVWGGEPLLEKLQKISNGMNQLGNDQDRLGAAAEIFGVRGGPQMLAVFEAGIPAVREFSRGLEESAGVAAAMEKENLKTLKGQFDLLTSAIDGVFLESGDKLRPELIALNTELTKFVNANEKDLRNGLVAWLKTIVQVGQEMAKELRASWPAIKETIIGFWEWAKAIRDFVKEHPRLVAMFAVLSVARLLGIAKAIVTLTVAFVSLSNSVLQFTVGQAGPKFLGFLGKAKGLIGTFITSLKGGSGLVGAFKAVGAAITTTSLGIAALTAAIGVLVGVIGYQLNPAIRAFKRETAKGKELDNALFAAEDERFAQGVADRKKIVDPQMRAGRAIQELRKEMLNQQGLEGQVAGAKKNMEENPEGWLFSKEGQVFREEFELTEKRLQRSKDRVAALREEIKASMGQMQQSAGQAQQTAATVAEEHVNQMGTSLFKAKKEIEEQQKEIAEALASGRRDAIERSVPGFGQFRDILGLEGVDQQQVTQLAGMQEGVTPELAARFGSAFGQMGGSAADSGQLDQLAVRMASIINEETRLAEARTTAADGVKGLRDHMADLKFALPEKEAKEFLTQALNLQNSLIEGKITTDQFADAIDNLKDATNEASEAAEKRAEIERENALIKGDWKGAGLNLAKSVQEQWRSRWLEFREKQWQMAVDNFTNALGGLPPALDNVAGELNRFSVAVDPSKVADAWGKLQAFFSTTQGKIVAIQNQLAINQQALRYASADNRREIEKTIKALQEALNELINAPPMFTGMSGDGFFVDPGLNDGRGGGGGGSRSLNITLPNITRLGQSEATQLASLVGNGFSQMGSAY